MIITAYNPTTDPLERTYLSQSYPLGVTSVELKNNSQFPNNTRALFGDMGLSETEIVTTGSPNANSTTTPISATLFGHPANTPVYNLLFDEVKFYRSTTGINGTYTLLAQVAMDVTNPNLQTLYNDNTAQSGYYYTISFYNSITGVESAQSDPIPAITGYGRNTVGYLMDEIFTELSDTNEANMTRQEVIGYLNEVNDDLLMSVVRPYSFLYTREVLGRTGGNNYLNFPTDSSGNQLMWKFDHLDYNYQDPTTSPVTNVTYTVEVAPSLEYFRNRWIQNTSGLAVPSNVTIGLGSGGSLKVGQFYYYVVTALYSTGNESGASIEVNASPSGSDQTIVLAWNAVPGAASYNIYRGLSSGGEYLLSNTTSLTYSDNGTASEGTQVPPTTTQDDMIQEVALDLAENQFVYYPTSKTSANTVFYLYYYSYFKTLTSEGDTLQTPTPRIYKMYVFWRYYFKRSATTTDYTTLATQYHNEYLLEKARLKAQDRKDVGTPRRFESQGFVRKSYRR